MRRLIEIALALCALHAPARAEDCGATGIGELGEGLIEHSCFHTTNGPFAEVTATPGAIPTAATPGVDAVHTHYEVAIDPAQANVVTYTPVRAGTWAIFGDPDVPHVLTDAAGQVVPVQLEHAVAGCPALPIVRVYTLSALAQYTLRLGPATPARTATRLVLEKVSDFEAQHGRDEDGDGFGGPGDVVSTACVPPPGYVSNVADCDDADAEVHPGAAERCDGLDNDCNGLGDEAACTVSGGGCENAPRGAGEPPAAPLAAPLALALALVAARGRRRRSRR